MAGSRRQARRWALQALYEWDAVTHDPLQAVERIRAERVDSSATYSQELVRLVLDHTAELDAHIQHFAQAWPVEQISIVDRNVLRIALCELLFVEDVPAKVAISEAVAMAKSYGGESSSRFVNGVLGSFLSQVPSRM